jgi:hypothetical protein
LRKYYNAVTAANGMSTTEHGFVIVDRRDRVWSSMFFPTEEAADSTMIRCGLLDRGYTVKPARYVHWHTIDLRRKQVAGSQRDTILVGDSAEVAA